MLPDTPQINFNYDSLTCDVCLNTVSKKEIDWSKRKQLFNDLVKMLKVKKHMIVLYQSVVVRIVRGK